MRQFWGYAKDIGNEFVQRHRKHLEGKFKPDQEIGGSGQCRLRGSILWTLSKEFVLKTDIFRLLMPDIAYKEEIKKIIRNDHESITQKIHQDIDITLKNTLKLWN